MKELNDWILHPTKEKPFVMEWFMDWFFKQLIAKDKVEKAKRAIGTVIIFTMICERMSQEQASDLVMNNIKSYATLKNPEWASKLYELLGI
jgi:hypothetical protein